MIAARRADETEQERELGAAALATTAAIAVVQRRAERELVRAKDALERKTAELARSVSMLHAALDSTASGIVAFDLDGNTTFCNAQLASLWRAPPDALARGRDAFLGLAAQQTRSPAEFLARARSLFAQPECARQELIQLADGRVLEHHFTPQLTDGRCTGTVSNFLDVTERRRAEQHAQQTQHLAALGTLAAGMAHEINNPLAYVIGNVEVCREYLKDLAVALATGGNDAQAGAAERAQLVEQVERIRLAIDEAVEGGERVRRVVAELRTLARRSDGAAARLDLQALLRAVIKMTDNSVRHAARVRAELESGLAVQAPPGALEQVFTNLLINAAHAIGDGRAAEHEIVLSARAAPAHCVVEVRDDGPGIAAEVLPRIFEPFFTTKPVGNGMGIGLSLCQSIVAALGGAIEVESEPGHGALFRVTLPRAADLPGARTTTAPAGQERRRQILVIDNQPSVGNMMARILGGRHQVTLLLDGREALGLLLGGASFDLIFCDLMMPSISGAEVFETLLAQRPEQARKFVFMTGGALSPGAEALVARAQVRHITKPFTITELRAIADAAVEAAPG